MTRVHVTKDVFLQRQVYGTMLDANEFPGSHRGLKMTKTEENAWQKLQNEDDKAFKKAISGMQCK